MVIFLSLLDQRVDRAAVPVLKPQRPLSTETAAGEPCGQRPGSPVRTPATVCGRALPRGLRGQLPGLPDGRSQHGQPGAQQQPSAIAASCRASCQTATAAKVQQWRRRSPRDHRQTAAYFSADAKNEQPARQPAVGGSGGRCCCPQRPGPFVVDGSPLGTPPLWLILVVRGRQRRHECPGPRDCYYGKPDVHDQRS